jgi:hypothetical protein
MLGGRGQKKRAAGRGDGQRLWASDAGSVAANGDTIRHGSPIRKPDSNGRRADSGRFGIYSELVRTPRPGNWADERQVADPIISLERERLIS